MTDMAKKDFVTEVLEDPSVRHEMEHEWFFDKIVVQIEQKMAELHISRKDLADRLGCSPPNVTQLLREGSNLTIRKLMDIALAIDHRFLPPELVALSGPPPWESCQALPVTFSERPWTSTGEGVTFALATSCAAGAARAEVTPYDISRCEDVECHAH